MLEELDDIKDRTFGIFLLQVFKTVRLIMRLLPAGRVILIALTVFTLLENWISEGELSGASVKSAIEESGLKSWLGDKLQVVYDLVDQIASQVDTSTLLMRDMATSISLSLEKALSELNTALDAADILPDEHAIEVLYNRVVVVMEDLQGAANGAFNTDVLLGPILEDATKKIRDIPGAVSEIIT